MKIWLIQIGEPLPTDSDGERLLRTGITARKLVEAGHDVLWWATSFDHVRKRFRSTQEALLTVQPGFRISLLHGRPYQRDVSLARIRNHIEVAQQFRELAEKEPAPDIILCSFPAVELARAATEYGLRHKVPVILDIRDMWPDTMTYLVPRPLRWLARLPLRSLARDAAVACAGATAITAHAPGFVSWGLQKAGRAATPLDGDFPFGYDDVPPEPAALESAEKFWDGHGVTDQSGDFVVCYIGAIGHQIRFSPVLEAARRIGDKCPVRLVFCGAGDAQEKLQSRVAGRSDALFVGRVGAPEIWTLMRRSSAGLVCVKNSPDYLASIPNKIPEYLSGGLPMAVNFPSGAVLDLVTEHRIGISYDEDPVRLADWILHLHAHPQERKEMSQRARQLYEDRFVARKVYADVIDHLEKVLAAHRAGA